DESHGCRDRFSRSTHHRNVRTGEVMKPKPMKRIVILDVAAGAFTLIAQSQEPPRITTPPGFNGKIALDIRDSKPDWGPYMPKKAPPGSPNFLFVLYDDTGLAAWSTYGGRINMPTLDRLAANGLIYTQRHTTALCSPSRSTILTGRNHHLNGMATITEAADGYPGASGRLPEQAATVAQILQDAGWSTYWIGKNHNVAEQDVASG